MDQTERSAPRERPSRGVSSGLLGGWVACIAISMTVGCSIPGDFAYAAWEVALGVVVFLALPVVLVALAMRTRTGIISSAIVATAALHLGLVDIRFNLVWGVGEVVAYLALAGASTAALFYYSRPLVERRYAPASPQPMPEDRSLSAPRVVPSVRP